MKLKILLFYLITFYSVEGQNTFSRSFDFDLMNFGFTNMLIEGDKITTIGIGQDSLPPYLQCIVFSKFDTLGNLLFFNKIYEPSGGDFSFGQPQVGFTENNDSSGYIYLAHIFQRNNGAVLKIDDKGNLEWIQEYPDSLSLQDNYYRIIELKDGYLIGGHKTDFNNTLNFFVKKIDFNGNQIWEHIYGDKERRNTSGGFIYKDENEIIVYGSSSNKPRFTNDPIRNRSSIIFAIDSLGEKKWEWESNRSLEELGVGSLHCDSNGNWNYVSGRGFYESDGYFRGQPTFMIRDSNFNLIVKKIYDDLDGPLNFTSQMIPISSGGWLRVGGDFEEGNGFYDWITYGSLMKLNETGDSIWHRNYVGSDTAFTIRDNRLNKVVEMPDGGFVAVGQFSTNKGSKDWGWLLKVDKNGCLDTTDCEINVSSSIEFVRTENIQVFPNPTSQNVTFSFSSSSKKQLIINNLSGSVIAEAVIPSYQTQYVWSSEKHPPGVYFYQVFFGREKIQSGKIMVQR